MSGPFFIIDLRSEWNRKPYVTLWRAEDAGYAWPLPWAGRYTEVTVAESDYYYTQRNGKTLVRFPVQCEIVEAIGVAPKVGMVDGNVGPVIPNNAKTRAFLRRHAFAPVPLSTDASAAPTSSFLPSSLNNSLPQSLTSVSKKAGT